MKKLNLQFNNLITLFIFLGLTFILVFPLAHTGKIMANSDWLFHASRIEELARNIKHGTFLTFIATQTFSHTGSGSFLFYPYVMMYPWALFMQFFNPITSFYLWYGMVTYLAFIISYISMKSFSHSQVQSVFFSLLYVTSAYRLYLGMWTLGEFVATTFLPIVFLGVYKIIFGSKDSRRNGVTILAIGMSLLIYTHILSVIMTIEIFVLIFIIYLFTRPRLFINRLLDLCTSAFFTILLTLPLIYIFMKNYIGKNISSTNVGILLDQLNDLSNVVDNSLNNIAGSSIGFGLFIIVLIGWYFIKDDKILIIIYFFGVSLLLVSTSIFPWYLVRNTLLGIIQLPSRYLGYSSLFLSIVGSKILFLFWYKLRNVRVKRLIFIFIFIITIVSFYSSLRVMVNYIKFSEPSNLSQKNVNIKLPFSVLNVNNYERQFNYLIPWGETDYFPRRSLENNNAESIINQTTFVEKEKVKNVKSNMLPNSLTYHLKVNKKRSINLPVIMYNGTFVKVNGKRIKALTSERGTVLIPKNRVGNEKLTIKVGFNPGLGFYICGLISLVAWLLIIVVYAKEKL